MLLNASEIRQVEVLPTQGQIMDKQAIELPGAAKYGPYSAAYNRVTCFGYQAKLLLILTA